MKTWTLFSRTGGALRRFKGDEKPNFFGTGMIGLRQKGQEVAFIMLEPGQSLSMDETQVWRSEE